MNDVVLAPERQSLIAQFASRMGLDPDKMLPTLKATVFKTDKPITNEQMAALLIVAEQYHLNPFTRELFAFPDNKGGIVPFVSVDGWARIVNEHPQFDGAEFHYDKDEGAMTCVMHRKDRAHPTVVTEYMSECKRNTAPWNSHPRRMLRHKALIQCARIAFGFAGLYDEDEAERIRDGGIAERVEPASTGAQRVRQVLAASKVHAGLTDREPEFAEEVQEEVTKLQGLMRELRQEDTTRERAEQLLDYGRSALSDEDYAELAGAFASIYSQETKE